MGNDTKRQSSEQSMKKHMNIGILAYHSACNYGANLQVLSTVGYLRRKGHNPIVINYEADEFIHFYKRITPSKLYDAFYAFRHNYMPLSKHCHTLDTLAQVIEDSKLDAIIIGSDAVAQHHPLLSRINFPTRALLSITRMTSDRYFPNPFWGTFTDLLSHSIPMALLSASSQDSNYKLFLPSLKKQMWERLQKFSYISVRDEWTKEMYSSISAGKLNVEVTPDPVFAFNANCSDIVPSKQEILEKYHLPENYLLLSFLNSRTVSLKWLEEFKLLAKQQGLACVALPFPQGIKFQHCLNYEIPSPLMPLDWYALIKYSQGYIGHNMHPIVVSLHNANPFFAFDNYGIKKFNGLYSDDYSSKIKHILSLAKLENNRVSCIQRSFVPPTPQYVFDKVLNFDKNKASCFAESYLKKYIKMMSDILQIADSLD